MRTLEEIQNEESLADSQLQRHVVHFDEEPERIRNEVPVNRQSLQMDLFRREERSSSVVNLRPLTPNQINLRNI
jgi:hypothetical protein